MIKPLDWQDLDLKQTLLQCGHMAFIEHHYPEKPSWSGRALSRLHSWDQTQPTQRDVIGISSDSAEDEASSTWEEFDDWSEEPPD